MAPEPPALPHPFVRPPTGEGTPRIAAADLARLREGPDAPYVVDLRPPSERRHARIPDDHAIPLTELRERATELPKDRWTVLYDHRGELAGRAAGLVPAHLGARIAVLDGGIDAYAAVVDPSLGRYGDPKTGPLVLQLPRPGTGCLAYLLVDPTSQRAILIDPGVEVAPYVEKLRSEGWTLDAIVESHTHADHLAGHEELHRRLGAPIYLGHRSPAAYPHRKLTAGEEIRAGRLALTALETPGHTRDHLTLRLGDRIFTGDTLLLGSCGRTDLGDGDPRALYESLHSVLGRLPGATEVYPAHYGPKHALPARYVSTLEIERATNEALRLGSEAEFLTYMTEGWPPKPAEFDRIVAANLAAPPASG